VLITIELKVGMKRRDNITKADVQKNIDAVTRAINGKMVSSDVPLLIGTKSILEAIKEKV
jgi:hypothetical protein